MLILKQRVEVWLSFLALHRIGAVCIPATFQLMPKDIIYRCNAASVKMIATVDEPELLGNILKTWPECKTLHTVAVVGKQIPDKCLDFRAEAVKYDDCFPRPTGEAATHNQDIMLMYFSSGTTGMPKMIAHDFTLSLIHIFLFMRWKA